MKLNIKSFDKDFAIAKFPVNSQIPEQILLSNEFVFISKTDEEVSVVIEDKNLPTNMIINHGWKMLKIEAKLDFSLVGIIANISDILAKHNISIFVISTFNTDYFLVKKEDFDKTKKVLSETHNIL